MANDLVPAPSSWIAPEAKQMDKYVRYGVLALLGFAGLAAFNSFGAPSLITALDFLNAILADTAKAAMYGVGLVAGFLFLSSAVSPTGNVNKMLQMPWWAFISWFTRKCMTVNPFGPIDERIKSVSADKETFDAQAAQVSGIVSRLDAQIENYHAKAAKAQQTGIAAHNKGNLQPAEDVAAHAFGTYRDTADKLTNMRAKLAPVLTTFQRIGQACDITIQKLKVDRDSLQTQWEAQEALGGALDAANKVLGRSKSQMWNLADQAESFIDTRYSDQLGHLEYLKTATLPLLQSIDLDNASYSEEMLADVSNTAQKLTQTVNATQLPSQPAYASLPIPGQNDSVLNGFLSH